MNRVELGSLAVAVFPVVLAAGIFTIPVVSDYSNHALAEQAARQTGRWFWGHLVSGVAFGLGIVAACSIADHLFVVGHTCLGKLSLPPATLGGALYAIGLGADGIGPLATVASGASAQTFFEGSGMWVSGVFIAASVLFGLGLIMQVSGILRARLLGRTTGVVVLAAALVFVAATAIPSGWGLYGVAVSALVVYAPISRAMWRQYRGLQEGGITSTQP